MGLTLALVTILVPQMLICTATGEAVPVLKNFTLDVLDTSLVRSCPPERRQTCFL
jgi:hypothetical protein